VQGFLDLLFPPLCLGCGEYTEDEHHVCAICREQIEEYDLPFCLACSRQIPEGDRCVICGDDTVPMFSYGNYTSPLKDIVIHFKFKGITSPAKLMAELLVARFELQIRDLDCHVLIPIPLYPTRENVRGYNQAELFASSLAELLDFEVARDVISRVKRRKEQARLDFRHRRKNIKGVFECDRPATAEERVILVDDVVTSGLTVLEAKRVLERGGYKVVAVLSIAHHI
jgi:ComF family protein